MAFSYSLHVSSKANAVSTTAKAGQISRHNLRRYKSEEYNRDDISILAGGEVSILDNLRKIYHSEFDQVLEEYNAHQKRADRQIDDYMKHVSNSQNDVAAEIIIQVGDMEFWKDISKEEQKNLDGLFEAQLNKLQELVPELKIASAVIHYDEKSPHMHVVGVPVAEGFKRGLEKQVSKTKVFTPDRLSYLQDAMRQDVQIQMQKYPQIFQDRELKAKEQGRNKDIPKYRLEEYYKLETEIAQKSEQLHTVDAVVHLMAHNEAKNVQVEDLTIPAKKSFIGRIETPERDGAFVEGMNKSQVEALISRIKADEGLEDAFTHTMKQAHKEANKIRQDAINEVEKAKEIVSNEEEILRLAREQAEELKKKAKKIAQKCRELEFEINQKEPLMTEIAELKREREKALNVTDQMLLQNYRNQAEHYKAKYKQLERVCRAHGIQLEPKKEHEHSYTR